MVIFYTKYLHLDSFFTWRCTKCKSPTVVSNTTVLILKHAFLRPERNHWYFVLDCTVRYEYTMYTSCFASEHWLLKIYVEKIQFLNTLELNSRHCIYIECQLLVSNLFLEEGCTTLNNIEIDFTSKTRIKLRAFQV